MPSTASKPAPARDALADALRDTLISPNICDSNLEPANVVDALDGIGRRFADALNRLGNADAATPMGAIEGHGAAVIEVAEKVRGGLDAVADAIDRLADAVAGAGDRPR